MKDLRKPQFKSLSTQDKQRIQFVLMYPIQRYRYEFTVVRDGHIHFYSPGTTSSRYLNDYYPRTSQSCERYLAQVAMFAVINLIKKGNLAMLVSNITVYSSGSPGARTVNLWELIEVNCGYTLENLKQLYEKEAYRGIPNRV